MEQRLPSDAVRSFSSRPRRGVVGSARSSSLGPRRGRRLARSPLLVLPLLLAWLACSLLAIPPAAAQSSRSVTWDRFDVEIDLHEDGSLHVVERQVVDFRGGPFYDGAAEIPLARIDAVDNVVVREETRRGVVDYAERRSCCSDFIPPETYEWEQGAGTLSVQWGLPGVEDERRVFLLEYDVSGVLRVYPEDASGEPPNQQLWWTVVAAETTAVAPVRAAALTLRLPAAVDPAAAVVGLGEAVVPAAEHTEDGRTWTWEASDLGPGDAFIARLQFPPLVAAEPPRWQRADDERRRRAEQVVARRALVNSLALGGGLLALVGGGVGLYGFWYLRGRDPHVGPVADFLPEPPDDLPPGAAGTLLDEVAHQRDVVATLVDLARRGVVAMERTSANAGAEIHLTLRSTEAPLARFEQELVRALFGWTPAVGSSVRLWEVSARFAAAAPEIRRRLYAELVDRGWFAASPEETREAWRDRGLTAFLVLLLGGGLAGVLWADGVPWYWFALAAAAALSLALYLLAGALPRKSAVGAEAAARWRAFRRYLEGIERYERVGEAGEIFDRYLPFAVAFGLERSWVETFARAGAPVPAWYALAGDAADPFDDDASAASDRGGWWRRRDDDRGEDWLDRSGGSWWDALGTADDHDERREGSWSERAGEGGGFRLPSLPDWQGTSDHAGRTLQGASNGLLSMFQTAGEAFSAFNDAAGSSDDDSDGGWRSSSSSRRSSSSSSGGRSSFSGGGRSGGSSGGGRRGFG